jgi:hypothetical protein
MKKSILSLLLCATCVFGIGVALATPDAAHAATPPPAGANKDPVSNKKVKDTSIVEYINDAYAYLALVGGLLAVMMLVWAGYRYTTSYGDPEKISDAKDLLQHVLIGLAVLILAAVILNAVNTNTTDPCTPGQPGCGSIDYTKPKG